MRLRSSTTAKRPAPGIQGPPSPAGRGDGAAAALPPPSRRDADGGMRPMPDPGTDIRAFRAALISRVAVAANVPMTIVIVGMDARSSAEALAADLAAATAQVGYDVLLVDANIEHPAHHARFDVTNRHGVSDIGEWMEDCTQGVSETSIAGLAVIAAGPAVANPAEVLERLDLCRRLTRIGRRFDMIVVDASAQDLPAAAAATAGSDGVIVVVRRHRTSIATIQRAIAAFADRGVPALGAVVAA